jgi:hypothetical protein
MPPLASFSQELTIELDSIQVEQIMLAPNSSYSISSLAALREVNALTSPMTKTQAESVLASFVAKGWLLKSKYVRPRFAEVAHPVDAASSTERAVSRYLHAPC